MVFRIEGPVCICQGICCTSDVEFNVGPYTFQTHPRPAIKIQLLLQIHVIFVIRLYFIGWQIVISSPSIYQLNFKVIQHLIAKVDRTAFTELYAISNTVMNTVPHTNFPNIGCWVKLLIVLQLKIAYPNLHIIFNSVYLTILKSKRKFIILLVKKSLSGQLSGPSLKGDNYK